MLRPRSFPHWRFGRFAWSGTGQFWSVWLARHRVNGHPRLESFKTELTTHRGRMGRAVNLRDLRRGYGHIGAETAEQGSRGSPPARPRDSRDVRQAVDGEAVYQKPSPDALRWDLAVADGVPH